LSRRYDRLRQKTGANHGTAERLTRPSVVAAIILVIGLGVYILWRRRRAPKTIASEQTEKPRVDPKLEAATALYRTLELALAMQGIPRPPTLPPLRHAEDLAARHHPLAEPVLELTNRYIEARFGGMAIDENAQRDYEKRVKEIRAFKPAPSAADSAP